MPNLGSLWYTLGVRDLTDADLQKINAKFKNLKSDIELTPKILKDIAQAAVPKGVKIELDPSIKNEALTKAAEGKVMRIEVMPLLTHLRKALKDATVASPPEIEVGIQAVKLRTLIESVLNKHGFMLNISTVNDNYTKVVQQKLNGTTYTVKIHADAKEITRSVQASLMQIQSRYFGLQVSKDVLRNSIDTALMGKPFNIQIAVMQDQARRAVQNALNNARMVGKDDALAYQRLQTGELKAAQAELARLKAANYSAADAAKAHASASISLGGAMGSNIKIAGELGSAMASLYSIHAAKEFLSQVIEIGGELEHQKIAMDTIFGDKGKTNELFGQIKGLARQSPFGVMELTKSVKALSAYGVQYNEIYETAKRLADISAATSVDINRLILAFGKTKSRGFLDGLEAKQFAYANIPIYEMVRKKLEELEGQAVTTADVMARMKKREIGFDIVKDVLWDMTDEGGKFYNMQEALAGSVKTSWKLVKDNVELMFGEIAESAVGSSLKSIAEVLQVLTRNWRTMGSAIYGAVIALGIYKIAVAASNQMMGLSNAATLKSAIASNLAKTAKLSEVAVYRQLTAAEQEQFVLKSALAKLNRSLLLSHKALTAEEWEAAFVNGKVTEEYILRRIALGKLTKAEIDYIVTSGMVDAQLVNTAVAASRAKISLASLWAIMKAGVASAWGSTLNFFTRFKTGAAGVAVSMQKLNFASFTTSIRNAFASALTWIKTLPSRLAHAEVSVTRLKLAFSGLGRAMSSIGAFILNPATVAMAAIGGLMYTWEKNNEQMEKAKEIGGSIFTKATEGATNLKQTLKGIKPSEGLTDHELTQGIEQLEQAIKDYSPRPLQDINDTLVAQDGHVLTLSERYDALKKKVEGLKDAYDQMGDVDKSDAGTMISDAIQSTGGLLNDTVVVNAKDYSNALKRRSDAIREATKKYSKSVKEVVDAAIKADANFAKAVEGMKNTDAMFNELASNPQKYKMAYELDSVSLSMTALHITDKGLGESQDKFESDVEAFIKDLTANIRITWDKEIEDLDDSQKDALALSLKHMLEQAEGVSEEVKIEWAKLLEKAFDIDMGFKIDATALIRDEFAGKMEELLGKELADKVRRGLTLSSEEKSKVRKAIYKSYLSVFERADEDVRRALNEVMQGKDMQLRTYGLITLNLNKNANATDWQQQLLDALGDVDLSEIDIKITGHSDINSFIDEARKGYKVANEAINELKPILIKAGISFVDGEEIKAVPLSLKGNDVALKAIDDYNDKVKATKAVRDALKAQGIDIDVDPNKKHKSKGTKKDSVAESLKQRFKDIKDAWSEFQKWSKTEGREAAASRIGESGMFSTLSKDKIPQTVEQYRTLVADLEKELKAAGVKGHSQRESLLNELLKQLLDIDKTVVDEKLKLALDKVSKEAERQLANWNLFKKISDSTGNWQLAMGIAFGLDATAETDYPAMIKQQLQKSVDAAETALSKAMVKEGESPYEIQGYTYDSLKALYDNSDTDKGMKAWVAVPEEIRKAWEKANSDILKYYDQQRDSISGILSEYRTLSDQIDAINAKRNADIAIVNGKNAKGEDNVPDKAEREKLIGLINTKADWDIFTKSSEYLQFFNDIYGLTLSEAERIGDSIQLNLNKRLQEGLISIYDYEKEMEKVRKQLEAIRNVKSDAMTFLTSGVSGLNKKKLDKEQGRLANDEGYQNALKEQIELQQKLTEAQQEGNEEEIKKLKEKIDLNEEEIKSFTAVRDAIIKNEEAWKNTLGVAKMMSSIAHGLTDSFNAIRDTAEALGVDTSKGLWDDIATGLETISIITDGIQSFVQSAMSGDIGGMLSSVVTTITKPITIWSQLHDKKLQKMIEASQKTADVMKNQYDFIERRMKNFLGNAAKLQTGMTGGAYASQRELLKGQLAELEKQRALEAEKKKSDSEALANYDAQIDDLYIQIRDFAIEAAKEVYSIDLNGWAEQLGDSLVDAFAAGEDAAAAFDKTVGGIMRDVTSKMISQDILAPMFGDLRDYLFGKDGKGGAYASDFELDEYEMGAMKGYLDKIKNEGIPAAQKLFDAINEATGGVLDDVDEATSSASAGIQSITEDTGGLIASYLNAIRASVSMNEERWERLLRESMPAIGAIAQSQLDCQRSIAENTLRTAAAAELIAKSNDEINRRLARVTQGGERFYVH